MSYCQYKIRCTNCDTDSLIISLESNPLMYQCKGCKKYVVIWNDKAFTVSASFFLKTVKNINLKYCGQITQTFKRDSKELAAKKSVKKNEITEEDIKELREFLTKTTDSSDIIKKL